MEDKHTQHFISLVKFFVSASKVNKEDGNLSVKYFFTDYDIPRGEQETVIDELKNTGVVLRKTKEYQSDVIRAYALASKATNQHIGYTLKIDVSELNSNKFDYKESEQINTKPPKYDSEKGILYLAGSEIKIVQRGSGNIKDDLLTSLFKRKERSIFRDEFIEENYSQEESNVFSKKIKLKINNAVSRINTDISKNTSSNIKDFIRSSIDRVWVDESYL